mmetsp:Transcript_5324/g.10271  ORF Transcript_5324/g.10271 Transcript_5324/m.10271 type:complete len:193 (-) Transcript_5324:119-697(-)
MIVFDVDIMLGARATKVSESKLDAFRMLNWSLLGEIRTEIQFSQDARDRHDRPMIFQPGFECRVAVFTLFPGFPASIIDQAIRQGEIRGIILQGFGSGNLSEQYLGVVQLAQGMKIPVVVTTQCLEGSTRMHWYRNGKQFLDCGAIQAYDMTVECVTTKLMHALHKTSDYEMVREIMHSNYVGEINKEFILF